MWFWVFMLFSNLLIPAVMIVVGWFFIKNPPKNINGFYGYRTPMSSKNMDTWKFAHEYCGKLWWKIGWIMLPFSVIAMLPLLGKDSGVIGIVCCVVITIQCVVMVASILPVEKALKKNFDSEGKRL